MLDYEDKKKIKARVSAVIHVVSCFCMYSLLIHSYADIFCVFSQHRWRTLQWTISKRPFLAIKFAPGENAIKEEIIVKLMHLSHFRCMSAMMIDILR